MIYSILLLILTLYCVYTTGRSLRHWCSTTTSKQLDSGGVHNIYRDVILFNALTFIAFVVWSIELIRELLNNA